VILPHADEVKGSSEPNVKELRHGAKEAAPPPDNAPEPTGSYPTVEQPLAERLTLLLFWDHFALLDMHARKSRGY